jgi:hypothetical protein
MLDGMLDGMTREDFLYWLKARSARCPPLAGRDPRAPGMRAGARSLRAPPPLRWA